MVTREEINRKTDKAASIIEECGRPKEEIMKKEILPEFGPVTGSIQEEEMEDILAALEQLESS